MRNSISQFLVLLVVIIISAIGIQRVDFMLRNQARTEGKLFNEDEKSFQKEFFTYEKLEVIEKKPYYSIKELFLTLAIMNKDSSGNTSIGVAIKDGSNFDLWTPAEFQSKVKFIKIDNKFFLDRNKALQDAYNDVIQPNIDKVVKRETDVKFVYDKARDPRAPYFLYIVE